MTSSFADLDAFFDDTDPSAPSQPTPIDSEADAFFTDSSPIDAPADALLRRLRDFTLTHSTHLAQIRESMCDTLTEAWTEENDTIAINLTPADPLTIPALVQTDNAQFNKVAIALGVVVEELEGMKEIAETKFYAPLTQFGHKYSEHALAPPPHSSSSPSTLTPPPSSTFTPPPTLSHLPTLEQEFGALLPILQDLSNFLTRLFSLTSNLLTQLGCLYHERQKLYLSTYRHTRLDSVFSTLGLALRIALTLDTIINDNPLLDQGWAQYKKLIRYVRADPSKYEVEVVRLRMFESLLLQLDKQILSVGIFQSMLEMEYGVVEGGGGNKALIESNKVLYDQFGVVVKGGFKRMTHSLDQGEAYDRHHLVDLFTLYALYRHLFRNTTKVDKRWFNELWVLQKRVPFIYLWGRVGFYIPEFLGKYAAIEAKSVVQPIGKAILSTRLTHLNDLDEAFNGRVDDYYNQLTVWLVRMESALKITSSHPVHTVLTTRAKLLITGVLLARSVHELLTSNIYLHLKLGVSFRARNIRSIAIGCEMLKTIQQCVESRQGMISEHFNLMIGQSTFVLKHLVSGMRKKVGGEVNQMIGKGVKAGGKSIELDGKLDQLAALSLTHSLLEQPLTPPRECLLHLTLPIALGEKMWSTKSDDKNKSGDEVRYQLWKLSILLHYQSNIDTATNCSFLYWTPNLVPVFFADLFSHPSQINRLPYLFLAFHDTLTLFSGLASYHRSLLKHEYKTEILSYLSSAIISPLCREVETDLRLHIHSVVLSQMQLRQSVTIRDLSKFIHLQPIRFLGEVVNLKSEVSHYLDWNFYNLNTVALHDWRVYAEMRNLALEKYGLVLNEVHLPGTSHYSESLDILELMRNIHVFVARYNYNMNTQIFIERAFDQKHVHSLSVSHISDSLRTHGTGVMNTTINFTYQFLVRKFKLFSEFLFDDHIKSKLIKLGRAFRDEKTALNSRFPFDYAERLNREVKKLGVSDDGSTFMDHFRRQITEVGNALGYVRMVRSGGLHFVSQGIKFIPDLNEEIDFEAEVKEEGLGQETIQAAHNVNRVLAELTKQFTNDTSYFALLVSIFSPVLNTVEQKHLSNFYLIVPSLMINYIDKLKDMKEKINKQTGRQEITFTDDGFVLGVAYMLKVLGLDGVFDSLHWFDSESTVDTTRRIVMTTSPQD